MLECSHSQISVWFHARSRREVSQCKVWVLFGVKIKRTLRSRSRAIAYASRLCALATCYWLWSNWSESNKRSASSSTTQLKSSLTSRLAPKSSQHRREMLKALNDRLCMHCSSLQRRLQYEVGSFTLPRFFSRNRTVSICRTAAVDHALHTRCICKTYKTKQVNTDGSCCCG